MGRANDLQDTCILQTRGHQPRREHPWGTGRAKGSLFPHPALGRCQGTRGMLCADSKGLMLLRSSARTTGQSPAPDVITSAPRKALLQSPSLHQSSSFSRDAEGMGSIPAVMLVVCTHPTLPPAHHQRCPRCRWGKSHPRAFADLVFSCKNLENHTRAGGRPSPGGPRTHLHRSTHLCSSFRETVTLRLCPRRKRAARMSAHCTISPSGPPFSTRGLKTSPDSSVRKPIWIKIWRDKERGQCWEGWCWGKGRSWVFQPKMTYGP